MRDSVSLDGRELWDTDIEHFVLRLPSHMPTDVVAAAFLLPKM